MNIQRLYSTWFCLLFITVSITSCVPLSSALPPESDSTGSLQLPDNLQSGRVERVIDGDTVDVSMNGETMRVRLIGINTPEAVDPRRPVQCYGREASAMAKRLLDGQSVSLEADATQDDQDRFGRLLRYIWLTDGRMANYELIVRGFAYESTYDDPYVYQSEFRQAEREAREAQRGLWSTDTCGGQRDLPNEQLTVSVPATDGDCDPAYPDVCIPSPPPALDCADIIFRRFTVLPPDPHEFDGNGDGIGCES
ncbi:MAG: hypothetical protein GFH27_549297n132 [Chloroflexi bacterium AL-W]|nr:hypothetical protein [Chloroflexi bacterium AL-N1]NOK69014.1 hypothetical protein [Chloroflexi bacterium AL-N10]NOK76997.1 hypothetical protein [Chloroflexi bacterium AL-N5]NOK82615.1 hypothetical protein [Chloroflexi bacterium AL-W]NOK90854.1 hypothetical protein [Chloroflexi bacterium AL-N15]